MGQQTVSLQLDYQESSRLRKVLEQNGWREDNAVSNEYIALRMRNSLNSVSTLYTSMKVVFQGNEDFTDIIKCIQKTKKGTIPHLGVDEVGKGDYFGPLVVVACFVNSDFTEKYIHLGITDSKKFSDSKIREMYGQLKDYKYYYPYIIYPQGYNRLYKEVKNASILLARAHSKVIEQGLKDLKEANIYCKKVVIDQFSSRKDRITKELGPLARKISFEQYHKGESDMAVACASIIARGIFLEEMDKMNKEYYFSFPKGASNVIASAKEFISKHGSKELEKVAKTSFKTTKKVIQSSF